LSELPAVDVVDVAATVLAVRDGTVTIAELSTTIPRLLGDVWAYIREAGDLDPGHNVVVYRGDPNVGPAPIEVGVQVARRFEPPPSSAVRCSELPAGRAAHAKHIGPYDAMAPAYTAIMVWARDGGHEFGGGSWEVYGDWTDDPAQLETDIYVLLAEPAE
jgi:effector-binding domain-containing protein